MGKFIDLTGRVFGRLTVVSRAEDYVSPKGDRESAWNCKCSCGNPSEIRVIGKNLKKGRTLSCGCLRQEVLDQFRESHPVLLNHYEKHDGYMVGFTHAGTEFFFDEVDFDVVKQFDWFENDQGYLVACKGRRTGEASKRIRMHRLITGATEGAIVDHINHRRNDNRRCNLRIVTYKENVQNSTISKNNTSGITGVYRSNSGSWCAGIGTDYKTRYLGSYKTFEDAVAARKAAEEKYFGEYSYDNSMAAVPRIAV